MKKLVFGLFLAVVWLVLNPKYGFTLTISPTLIDVVVESGETIMRQIRIFNETNLEISIASEIFDVVLKDETGATDFIELRDNNISFDFERSFTLQPNEWRDVLVNISASVGAMPGTHPYAILFNSTRISESENVNIISKSGPIILVNISDNVNQVGRLLEFSASDFDGNIKDFFDSPPAEFSVRSENLGNVYFTPSGSITIKDVFGRQVNSLEINEDGRKILPGWRREFQVLFNQNNEKNGFKREWQSFQVGRFKALLNLKLYDGNEISREITYWVLPWRTMSATLGILVVILFLIFTRRHRAV